MRDVWPVLLLIVFCSACASSPALTSDQEQTLARYEDCKQETGATSVNIKVVRDKGVQYTGNNLDLSRMRECLRTKYGFKFPGDPDYRGVPR